METSIPPEDPLLMWKAPEHPQHTRSRLWYACALIVVVACCLYSIATQAWTFLVITIMASGLYWHTHAHTPSKKRIRIWKRGFAMEGDYTEWMHCNGYWILRGPDYAELHIEKKDGTSVKIQTGDVSPFTIHDILSPLTEELEDRRERLLDIIIRICKL